MANQPPVSYKIRFKSILSLAQWLIATILIHGNLTAVHADEINTIGNQGTHPVVIRPGYDYAPALMSESGSTKMWWCGNLPGVSGDQILYLENLAPGEEAHYEQVDKRIKDVFGPSGNKGKFDSEHTCDPSVIHVGGQYYMYYGGIDVLKKRQLKLPNPTAIGVAVSNDGIHWMRANEDVPILTVVEATTSKHNTYGVGQPAAVYVSPYYYLLFTDTTASIVNSNIGANLFVVRSKDPLFSTFEELTQEGFRSAAGGKVERNFRIVDGFSAEMIFVETWDLFMIAVNRRSDETSLYFFDNSFHPVGNQVSIRNKWSEGPGILRDELGHVRPGSNGVVNLEIVSPVGDRKNPGSWDLYSTLVELERVEKPLTIKTRSGMQN